MAQRAQHYRVVALCAAITLLCATCATRVQAGQADGEVTIVRSDDRSLVFEYAPVFLSPRQIAEGTEEYTLFDFAGSATEYTEATTGGPDIRYKTFPLGFPTEAGNVVQVIASDYEDIPNVTLAPVPTFRVRDEMVEVSGYRLDAEKYSAGAFVPSRVVYLTAVGSTRSMLLGSVKVFPIQYNPATRTVRKYTRLVVQVVYGIPKTNRVQNRDDILFKDVLLNYDVARSWKFGSPRGLAKAGVPSLLSTGEWYRLSVAEEGVYVLSAQYLASAGIDITNINPTTIKIYGNGGTEVPENIGAPRPNDLIENAIYVEGEGDGRLDDGDYVMFFGRSTRGWRYNPTTKVLNHYINHYSEENYYWLTFGGSPDGRRMLPQASLPDNPVVMPAKFLDGTLIEEERVNLFSTGKDWYGQAYNPGAAFTYARFLPGLAPNDVITYRYSLIARAENAPRFAVKENGQTIGTHGLGAIGYTSDYEYATQMTAQVTGTSSLPSSTSQLNFSFNADVAGAGWNDWIEIQYPRRFEAVNNYLRFRSPDTTGVVEYQLTQLASPFILNVTQFDDVRRITGAVGTYAFRAAENAGQVSEYCAAGAGAFKSPTAITRIGNQDLRGMAGGYDFIILTTPEFRNAADRLRTYREQPAHGNLRTIVVDVNQIYNEFGGGIPDITAIRDFLKYAYTNWVPSPLFVLMFGQGSYDYKGILGSRTSYAPTWQSLESRHGTESYCTDDFFVKFDPFTNHPSMVTGRIPSRSVEEAEAYVNRLIAYEENSARDSWKMRTLFIADDGWTSEGGDTEGLLHAGPTEDLAEAAYAPGRRYTPEEFERRKVYVAEYPTVNSAQGRRKPGAYQAIIDEINRGVLILNYAGHGNPTVWAHESIFSVQTSIPQLTNVNKLTLFILATCNFSQFDDPKRSTGSELLINRQGGGAIGVISATRKVFAGANSVLQKEIFRRLFDRDAFSRLIVERPATALFVVKVVGANSVNDQKYFYMGDPTMRLQYPAGYASIDSINQQRLDSTIQLKALARITMSGTVRDQNNLPDSSFQGTLLLSVNDASRTVTIANFPPGGSWPYFLTGATIYRGENSVRSGRFNATFVVPKDIAYADSSTRGRMVAYFISPGTDGAGYTGNIRIGGTEVGIPDTTGPTMNLYLNTPNFRSGDMVSEDPVLHVDLVDSNGINTSVSGLGHRIEAWVNNSPQSRDMTDFYSSKLDNYQQGTVQYPLTGLPLGKNMVRVRAWDTHNNAATTEAVFEVASSQQLRISDVLNYPNPFARETRFTFKQNLQSSLNVTVKIYTLAGRLIQSLATVTDLPFVSVPWDGRDRDGDVLANGVYLYKVIVRTADGRFSSESLGKLSVLK